MLTANYHKMQAKGPGQMVQTTVVVDCSALEAGNQEHHRVDARAHTRHCHPVHLRAYASNGRVTQAHSDPQQSAEGKECPAHHAEVDSVLRRAVRSGTCTDFPGPEALNITRMAGRLCIGQPLLASEDIARYPIDQGADVNRGDSGGWTPLHIASSGGFDEVVKELLGAGADVNARNEKGLTPLHYAASKSRIEIGKSLIARGADINAKDRANQTPLCLRTDIEQLRLDPLDSSLSYCIRLKGLRKRDSTLRIELAIRHFIWRWNLPTPKQLVCSSRPTNIDGEMPEDMEGVGGQEQRPPGKVNGLLGPLPTLQAGTKNRIDYLDTSGWIPSAAIRSKADTVDMSTELTNTLAIALRPAALK
ncbi:hypothetical protein NUW54_g5906 [Trametes sanguinea]|uniref:Uncharacterized protein n=1 Tax=Trametes sanguinea TaxID=158606 RepID=A0ACC1PTS2_9APHY|nr:hypothetical protein NUW54_g5906 [Trametes sanguinea]